MSVTRIRRAGVAAAATRGRRELLVALRDKIASEIDRGVPARELASLSRRLVDIADQLELVDVAADGIAVAALTPDEAWGAD